jgi:hypothetical protein
MNSAIRCIFTNWKTEFEGKGGAARAGRKGGGRGEEIVLRKKKLRSNAYNRRNRSKKFSGNKYKQPKGLGILLLSRIMVLCISFANWPKTIYRLEIISNL